jgi:hypothetical protein
MAAQTWASYNGTISQASFQILYSINCEYLLYLPPLTIVGHRYSGIRPLSPVQGLSGTGLVPPSSFFRFFHSGTGMTGSMQAVPVFRQ